MADPAEAATHLAAGNTAFVDEDFPLAIEHYGKAIAADSSSHMPHLNRCAAYLKLRKPAEAIKDASNALLLSPGNELGLYRMGVACFELERFPAAQQAFREGQKLYSAPSDNNADTRRYATWLRKCEAELDSAANIVAAEAPQRPPAPSQPKLVAAAPAVAAPPVAHLSTRFQYYQSQAKVTVDILVKGATRETSRVSIEEQRLRVWTGIGSGKEELVFDKLLHEEVVPEECRTRFLASKIEVVLKKKNAFEWPDLGALPPGPGAEPAVLKQKPKPVAAADGEAGKEKRPKPYSSQRDWESIDKEVARELAAEKPEGEEALNDLFRQIYKGADEDTRRAMVKSFQTSGGTVLSTNWKEVGNADYEKERTAPQGMEWRTWEGQKLEQKGDDDDLRKK